VNYIFFYNIFLLLPVYFCCTHCTEKKTGTNYTYSVIHSVHWILRCPHHIRSWADWSRPSSTLPPKGGV